MMALRLTAQATPRNKFAIFWDEQKPCEGGAAAGFSGSACRTSGDDLVYGGSTAAPTPSASATLAPETAAYRDFGNRVYQAKWTAPVTNRLLLEAGFGSLPQPLGRQGSPGARHDSDLIRVVEQCATGCAANGNIAEPDLSLGQLVVEHQLELAVECGRVAGDRQPQRQVRLSGRAALRRPQELHELRSSCSTVSTTPCRIR